MSRTRITNALRALLEELGLQAVGAAEGLGLETDAAADDGSAWARIKWIQELLASSPVTYDLDEKPTDLTITIPDNTVYGTVVFTDDDGTVVLTLPTGATNIGGAFALYKDITADQGTATKVNVVLSETVTETDIANGWHLYLCNAEGVWKNMADILASAARVADLEAAAAVEITAVPYPLAVQVADKVHAVNVEIVDGGSTNTIELTLPAGAVNIAKELLILVSLTADAGTACKININYDATQSFDDAANGAYYFRCIAAGTWVPVVYPSQT